MRIKAKAFFFCTINSFISPFLFTMLPKLFVLAAVALSAVNAQTEKFQFKETYPEASSIPKPKPEWMELIKNANITNAPVLKANGYDGK